MQIRIEDVRLAFPQLFRAKAIDGGSERFSACFIIDPASKAAKEIKAAMVKVATEKWGDKGAAVLNQLKKDRRVCYREEERANKDGEVYEGFEGMHSLNASNKVQPLIIDRSKVRLTEKDGKPYAGCYVNAQVEVWAQNNPDPKIGRRINCTVLGVQFVRDGDAFGGASVASEDAFDSLEPVDASDLT